MADIDKQVDLNETGHQMLRKKSRLGAGAFVIAAGVAVAGATHFFEKHTSSPAQKKETVKVGQELTGETVNKAPTTLAPALKQG